MVQIHSPRPLLLESGFTPHEKFGERLARNQAFFSHARKRSLFFEFIALRWEVRFTDQMSALAILSQPRKRSVVQISEPRPGQFASTRRLPN